MYPCGEREERSDWGGAERISKSYLCCTWRMGMSQISLFLLCSMFELAAYESCIACDAEYICMLAGH